LHPKQKRHSTSPYLGLNDCNAGQSAAGYRQSREILPTNTLGHRWRKLLAFEYAKSYNAASATFLARVNWGIVRDAGD
jgi:hypothetical protein